MTKLNEEEDTMALENDVDPLPPSLVDKVDVVENSEANLVETITMTPKAPPPPCPPPPPPPPPFEGFQFDESERQTEKCDENEEQREMAMSLEGHMSQSNDDLEDGTLAVKRTEKTKHDEAGAKEGVLLDLMQTPPEANEEHSLQEDDLLNLSAVPPLDSSGATENQGDGDAANTAGNDENVNSGERRGWGIFRRISSRNATSGTANSVTNDGVDDAGATSKNTSDTTGKQEGNAEEKEDEMDTTTTTSTTKSRRERQQQTGQRRRRRRWGLSQIQSNNSDSDDNQVCDLEDDREVEEDYDGVVVNEQDGSDGDGVKRTVVLDGVGLRVIEQNEGDDSDEDNGKGDGETPQPRNWLSWRGNRQQTNNSNAGDDGDDHDSTGGDTVDKKKEVEDAEKEDDQLLKKEDETSQSQRRYWTFRRSARQIQHHQTQLEEDDHDGDDDHDDKALLKTTSDENPGENKCYADDVCNKNNEELNDVDENLEGYKDLLDSAANDKDDDNKTNNDELSAASPAPVVRRGFFGLRRYQDDPNVLGDKKEVKEMNIDDSSGSFRDKDKQQEIKGEDDDDEDESDEEKALTGSRTKEGNDGGGRVPWIGNHFLGSMKLHSQSYSMNVSSRQTSNQGENEEDEATPFASSATYYSTVSTSVNTKEDYYGTEVKSSAIIKDEKSGEEKGASYYSFPSVADDGDDDYDDDKVERHYGDDILDVEGNMNDGGGKNCDGDEWRRQQQDPMEEKTFTTSKPPPKGWRWSRQNKSNEDQSLISAYSDSNDGPLSSPSCQVKKMEGFGNSDSGRNYAGVTSGFGANGGDDDDVNLLNKEHFNSNQNRKNVGLFSSFRRRNNNNEQQQEQTQLKDYVERRTGGTLESMPIQTSSFENKNVLEGLTEGITNVAASIIAPELYTLDTMDQIVGEDTQGEYRFVSTESGDSDDDDNVEHGVADNEVMKLREKVVQLEKIIAEKNDEVKKWKDRVKELETELLLALQKDNERNASNGDGVKEVNLLSFSDPTKPNEVLSAVLPQSSFITDIKATPDTTERSESMRETKNDGKGSEFAHDVFIESKTKDITNEGQLIDLSSPSKDSECDREENDTRTVLESNDGLGKRKGISNRDSSREEATLIDVLDNRDVVVEHTEISPIYDVFHGIQTGEKDNDNDVISDREDEELIPLSA